MSGIARSGGTLSSARRRCASASVSPGRRSACTRLKEDAPFEVQVFKTAIWPRYRVTHTCSPNVCMCLGATAEGKVECAGGLTVRRRVNGRLIALRAILPCVNSDARTPVQRPSRTTYRAAHDRRSQTRSSPAVTANAGATRMALHQTCDGCRWPGAFLRTAPGVRASIVTRGRSARFM